MTPTQQQRTAYRKALVKRGLPEVYAHMAAAHLDCTNHYGSLWSGFIWSETPEGPDFWRALHRELKDFA